MANYFAAPEVDTLASRVIDTHVPRGYLTDCLTANIKYLFKSAKRSRNMGQCNRTTGKWKYLTDYDYVVEIWKEAWDNMTTRQKEALLYHELRHIVKVEIEKEDGTVEIKWKTYDHEQEFFNDELAYYGMWSGRLAELRPFMETTT